MPERADALWAAFFGIPRRRLREPGTVVVPHVGLGDWSGAWLFVRGGSVVVSAPARRVAALRAADVDPARALDPAFARALFGDEALATVGPAWHGVLAPRRFRPAHDDGVRLATASDRSALEALRSACGPLDWEHGGPPLDAAELAVAFRGARAVAASALRPWPGADAGDPIVVTHPDWRGRGLATAVASAVVERALRRGTLVLYQTLLSNGPALRVAERLGYEGYAAHLAVRLRG